MKQENRLGNRYQYQWAQQKQWAVLRKHEWGDGEWKDEDSYYNIRHKYNKFYMTIRRDLYLSRTTKYIIIN